MVNVEQIAIEIGFSYLNGGYGKWEDGSGMIHKLDSMSSKYLDNCINFIDRGIDEIDSGYLDKIIKENIKKQSGKGKVTKKCLEDVKLEMIRILQDKKDEIEEI